MRFYARLKVAGVTFENRQSIIKNMDILDPIFLKRERSNPHDSNAIAVYHVNGQKIGYIPRENAKELAIIMDKGQEVRASISKLAGGNGYKYGVEIDVYIEQPPPPIVITSENDNDNSRFIELILINSQKGFFNISETLIIIDATQRFPKKIQCFDFISLYIMNKYKASYDLDIYQLLQKAELIWYGNLIAIAGFPYQKLTPYHFLKLLLSDLFLYYGAMDAYYYLKRIDKGETPNPEDVAYMLLHSDNEVAQLFGERFEHLWIGWEKLTVSMKKGDHLSFYYD